MKLIDSHCHINDKKYKDDFLEIIEKIKNDLEFVVNIGYDLRSSEISVNYAKKYPFIYATVGYHPTDIANYNDEIEKILFELGQHQKVLAIGEIGLDYHWMSTPKEHQKEIFERQINIARKLKKPIVVHSRDAMEDTIDVLNANKDIEGIVHCYPGSYESAKLLMDRFYFGIGGVLTFAKNMVATVEKLPIEKIILETDAPYLSPNPFRGKRNEPSYVKYVAEKVAEIKNMSYEDVVRITNENTKKAYKMILN